MFRASTFYRLLFDNDGKLICIYDFIFLIIVKNHIYSLFSFILFIQYKFFLEKKKSRVKFTFVTNAHKAPLEINSGSKNYLDASFKEKLQNVIHFEETGKKPGLKCYIVLQTKCGTSFYFFFPFALPELFISSQP